MLDTRVSIVYGKERGVYLAVNIRGASSQMLTHAYANYEQK